MTWLSAAASRDAPVVAKRLLCFLYLVGGAGVPWSGAVALFCARLALLPTPVSVCRLGGWRLSDLVVQRVQTSGARTGDGGSRDYCLQCAYKTCAIHSKAI